MTFICEIILNLKQKIDTEVQKRKMPKEHVTILSAQANFEFVAKLDYRAYSVSGESVQDILQVILPAFYTERGIERGQAQLEGAKTAQDFQRASAEKAVDRMLDEALADIQY